MARSSESKIEIDLRAKTRAFNLRVRFKRALWKSRVGKISHHVSGSIRARVRTLILRVSVTLLQVLGASNPPSWMQSRRTEVRYSLRLRLHKLWLRIRGKHHEKAPGSLTPPKKTKWRRTLSSICRRNKTSVKITTTPSQTTPVNGHAAAYMDAFGTDRALRVLHGVGMASTLMILVQLAGTRGLPSLVTFVTALAVVGRLVFVNRSAFIANPGLQKLWHDAMSVDGASLAPQVLRAIFRPYMPQFGITGSANVMGIFTLILILLARYKRLPFNVMRLFEMVSAGIPAILVLWAHSTVVDLLLEPCQRQLHANFHGTAGSSEQLPSRVFTK